MPTDLITKRLVDAAEPQRNTYLVRDTRVKGFVLVVTAYGGKSYAIEYRAGRGRKAQKRRYTIGKHGSPWTPDLARRKHFGYSEQSQVVLIPSQHARLISKQ